MKKKLFYIVIVYCLISMLSFTGKDNSKRNTYFKCFSEKINNATPDLPTRQIRTGLEFSFFHFLLF